MCSGCTSSCELRGLGRESINVLFWRQSRCSSPAEAARRNILSGAIWSPFIHLSANLVQTRYDISETLASRFAAILLCGAIVLYPIVSHKVTTHTLEIPLTDSTDNDRPDSSPTDSIRRTHELPSAYSSSPRSSPFSHTRTSSFRRRSLTLPGPA